MGGSAAAVSGDGLRLQILGPVRVWRDGVELDTGPRQQLCLLAVLLARAGQPVSTDELVDLIWGRQAPASALNVIHKYVGTLRRLFEPSLPVRNSGSFLERRGNGYLFASGSATLDWEKFQSLVSQAKCALAEGNSPAALDHYVRALELWNGASGEGLSYAMPAAPVFAGINAYFFDVCVAAAELAVALSCAHRLTASLRLATSMAPLNEPIHAALISVLAATGQQAEALDLFRAVRRRLAGELGIDPGQSLRRAHQRVLSQQLVGDVHRDPRVPDPNLVAPVASSRSGSFVGRVRERAAVGESVGSAIARGAGLLLVEGEPGIGKTRLLEECGALAAGRGVLIAWGNTPPSAGTPAMWSWVQAIGVVLQAGPEEAQRRWRAGEIGHLLDSAAEGLPPPLPDSGARFRLFERVTALLGEAAAARPVMVVIDDLHWADLPSLELFTHVASRLPAGVVLVGALRDKAPAPRRELTRLLATASRVPGVRRITLEPLTEPQVAELIRIETGREPSDAAVGSVYRRTAGNPFFARELARLLAHHEALTGDAPVPAEVPATVRDIVLDRLTDVDDEDRGLLFTAALIGRDVDLRVLAPAAGLDVEACLAHIEPLEGLGILHPTPDPFVFSFFHDLVREAVVGLAPSHRVSRLHARIADALQSCATVGESVDERLAQHLWAAGPCVESDRISHALMRADGRRANQCAFEAAVPELELAALGELDSVGIPRAV